MALRTLNKPAARNAMLSHTTSRLLPRLGGLIAAPSAAAPSRRCMARAAARDENAAEGQQQEQGSAVQPHRGGPAPVQRRRARDPFGSLMMDPFDAPSALLPFGR
jgi:hypothetical protein